MYVLLLYYHKCKKIKAWHKNIMYIISILYKEAFRTNVHPRWYV